MVQALTQTWRSCDNVSSTHARYAFLIIKDTAEAREVGRKNRHLSIVAAFDCHNESPLNAAPPPAFLRILCVFMLAFCLRFCEFVWFVGCFFVCVFAC